MSDWNDIETLWRSNEPPEIGDIGRRLKRQTRLIRAWIATELAIGLGVLGFGIYIAIANSVPVGLGVIAFAAFALNRCWVSWRGGVHVDTGSPRDTIASALARNAALARYVRANYFISLAAVALIAGMVFTGAFGPADDAARQHSALVAVTIGLSAIVVWLAGCAVYGERLTRERERLLALKRTLGLED